MCQGLADLRKLLSHGIEDGARFTPIEADLGGALLELVGAGHGGQGERHAIQPARGPLLDPRRPLCGLVPFPGGGLRMGIRARGIRKHMRVSPHELGRKAAGDRCQVEIPALGSDLCVEDHLEEQVAQLVFEVVQGAPVDGVRDLVGLFDGKRDERGGGLFAIPGATGIPIPQTRHDLHELIDGLHDPLRRLVPGLLAGCLLDFVTHLA